MSGVDASTEVNAVSYGAVGTPDNSAAIQAAVDAAQGSTRTRRVYIPAGTYVLDSTVTGTGPVEIVGEGQERTIIVPPDDAPAFALGSLDTSQPHGLRIADLTFRRTTAVDSTAPVLDILQYGRKWEIERCNFDLGFSDRTCIRLHTSWVGAIRDCNFWQVGAEGIPSNRAAILVKPQQLGNGNGPINNVTIADCAFERVQAGIDLHDPTETGTTTAIYSVVISGCRFKNSSTAGPVANSVGIRSSNNNTFAIAIIAPFFEDFATGISARGHGWIITAPFGQSADTVIDLVAGGEHQIQSMILQPSANNEVGTGILCRAGVTGNCSAQYPKSITGAAYLTALTDDQSGGKLLVTAA